MNDPVGGAAGAGWAAYESLMDSSAEGAGGAPDEAAGATDGESMPGDTSVTTFADGDVRIDSSSGSSVRYDGGADLAYHGDKGTFTRLGDTGAMIDQDKDGGWRHFDADGNALGGDGFVTKPDELAEPDGPGEVLLDTTADDPSMTGADIDTSFTVKEHDNGDLSIGNEKGQSFVIEGGADFEYVRANGSSISVDGESGDIELRDADGNEFTRTGEGSSSYRNVDGGRGGMGPVDDADAQPETDVAGAVPDALLTMLSTLENAGVLDPNLAAAILQSATPEEAAPSETPATAAGALGMAVAGLFGGANV